MHVVQQNIRVIIASVLALVLQVVIVPSLSISLICPNALFVFCIVLSMVRPTNTSMVVSFVLGLVGGALTLQTLGIMAAVMVVVSFVIVRFYAQLNENSPVMIVICIALGSLACELFYGFLLVQFGMDVSFARLCLYRCIPCALYDCALGFVLYAVIHRFVGSGEHDSSVPVAQLLR